MSFLDKLKNRDENSEIKEEKQDDNKSKQSAGFMQLDVDIYQNDKAIIIIAPIPGVEVKDVDISIENENDVVTIQGRRELPEFTGEEDEDDYEESGKYLRQECGWGKFYRQIILPQEINVSEVEAKFKKGILILTLPLLRLQTKGKRKIVVNG